MAVALLACALVVSGFGPADHLHPATDVRAAVVHAHADASGAAEKTELFMEPPPLVAGTDVRMAVHLTTLADFQPLNAGRPAIDLVARSGAATTLQGTDPLRPDAFRVEGRLPAAGTYVWRLRVQAGSLTDVHVLGSITVFATAQAALAAPPAPEATPAIAYLKEQQWARWSTTRLSTWRTSCGDCGRTKRARQPSGARLATSGATRRARFAPPSSLRRRSVMANLPLALIGGVVGVFASGGVLSVASVIGFITLFGIATRNGIMLVSHIRHLREEEGVDDFRTAVERGATERLVPILMTALAAGLALIPLALSGGRAGSEIRTPMAIVILCGLATSTLLNMAVVPTSYLRFGRQR